MEEHAGIRDVKKMLSRYIRRVKMGETITITDRGVPVARLSPIHAKVPVGAVKMVDEGLACWQGNRPGQFKPVRKKIKGKSLSKVVSEDRR